MPFKGRVLISASFRGLTEAMSFRFISNWRLFGSDKRNHRVVQMPSAVYSCLVHIVCNLSSPFLFGVVFGFLRERIYSSSCVKILQLIWSDGWQEGSDCRSATSTRIFRNVEYTDVQSILSWASQSQRFPEGSFPCFECVTISHLSGGCRTPVNKSCGVANLE